MNEWMSHWRRESIRSKLFWSEWLMVVSSHIECFWQNDANPKCAHSMRLGDQTREADGVEERNLLDRNDDRDATVIHLINRIECRWTMLNFVDSQKYERDNEPTAANNIININLIAAANALHQRDANACARCCIVVCGRNLLLPSDTGPGAVLYLTMYHYYTY